ncbi:MAG: hypothetical protein CMQ78_04905 [Gammaproteobacteria bacterium]|nr:hypothetical protein [Gammaproteobacteria bacterium]
MVVNVYRNPGSRACFAKADKATGMLQLIDQLVICLFCPDYMAPDRVRALIFVETRIDKLTTVGAPFKITTTISQRGFDWFAGACSEDSQGIAFRTLSIFGDGE